MTAREQRQQRRRARAIRRRVSRVLAFLALLAALVLIVAARAKDKTGEAVLPETDPLPLATVTTIETAPPVTLAPVAESEAVSRYAGIEISDEDVYTLACLAYHEARGRSPLSRSCSIGACPTTSRIRSRRSYFRSTATYGSSPPLHISTQRSRRKRSTRPSMPHSRRRSLSSLSIRCTFPRGPITTVLSRL